MSNLRNIILQQQKYFKNRLRCVNKTNYFPPLDIISNLAQIEPSGHSTQRPCAVEHNVLIGWRSNLSPGASAYQRIISNNFYAHDEQGDNPR